MDASAALREADAADLAALQMRDDLRLHPLHGLPVAILDFETTGVDPKTCWPVSVAVVHTVLDPDAASEVVLNILIRPPIPVPPDATAIHGIDDAAAATGLAPEQAVWAIHEVVAGRALCVYNLPYDWTILNRLVALASLPACPWLGLDPLVWVKHLDKYERGKKLGDACARRGLAVPGHKATEDALAVAFLLPRLLRELGERKVEIGRTFGDLWTWQRLLAVEQEKDYARWCARSGKPAPTCEWSLAGHPDGG